MHSVDQLAGMDADALRSVAAALIERVARMDGDIARLSSDNRLKQFKIDQLTHEMAVLRRWKFAASSERLGGEQKVLFEEMLDAGLAARPEPTTRKSGCRLNSTVRCRSTRRHRLRGPSLIRWS
jgi:hypothetical protein